MTAELVQPKRLVPVHIQNQPPPYFIIAGLVFTQVLSVLQPALGSRSFRASRCPAPSSRD